MRTFATNTARAVRALCSLLAASCVVLATAACGGEVDADTTAQPGEISIDLAAQDGARLAGARALIEYRNKQQTRVLVDGFGSGEQSATMARVVKGTCDEPGQLAFAFAPIRDGTS